MSTSAPVLRLEELRVALATGTPIVDGVDLELGRGEILGLVGESGSGKTTTALALLGYAQEGVEIVGGGLAVEGRALRMNESMRPLRGSTISYVPQDPGGALNPSLRIVDALRDVIEAHRRRRGRAPDLPGQFTKVGLPAEPVFTRRFPHELSGGQQQRICIALALSNEPAVVVLDEPTTGLDVVTQERILAELLRLRDEHGISMVYVTHDLAVVAQIADRIAVMYGGRIVEQGPAASLLRRPRHPYTRGLIMSIPDHLRPHVLEPMPGIAVRAGASADGCSFAPRCPHRTDRCIADTPTLVPAGDRHVVRCFHWRETEPLAAHAPAVRAVPEGTRGPLLEVRNLSAVYRSRRETVVAADDVSFSVERGSCVALVGESGSGKTTIARATVGLHPIASGSIVLDGQRLPSPARNRTREQFRRIQFVFQNPAAALNPRHTVARSIARPAQVLRGLGGVELAGEVDRLLEAVRLPSHLRTRYPHELSGGERQRVAIARAIAPGPDLLVCDEITAALDVSVQAAVLKLLRDLSSEFELSMLFITHDLGVVAAVAEHVLVLEGGRICERGPTESILDRPAHPYTQRLLAAAPSISALHRNDTLTGQPDDL
jgi:peptide/nickel transport system ATP-binding protein